MLKMMEPAHAKMDFLTQHAVKDVTVRMMRHVQKIQDIVKMVVQRVILEQLAKEYATVKMAYAVKQMELVTAKIPTLD